MMSALRTAATAAGLLICLRTPPASAQIDYRNLDDERPVTTEDAYPIERYAFEFLAPYRFERERGGERRHVWPLELEYGVWDNTEIGVAGSVAGVDPGPGADS